MSEKKQRDRHGGTIIYEQRRRVKWEKEDINVLFSFSC